MNTVIFTGAGAGRADGLPLQADLFREFFSRLAPLPTFQGIADNIAEFFQRVFELDRAAAAFPTFEEVLGVLDLAASRSESMGEFGSGDVRRQLILAMGATLSQAPGSGGSIHRRLIASLRESSALKRVTFVTTNYDRLLEDAIELEASPSKRGIGPLFSYGIEHLSDTPAGRFRDRHTVPCYKIHGSLNWLECPVCSLVDITYNSDGIVRLISSSRSARCPSCNTLRTPVIVPPTYYKNLSSICLASVWHRAFQALRRADRVVFCGYSFPDADVHVKYLLKRAQYNRPSGGQPFRVSLVNDFAAKAPAVASSESDRYCRFLGREYVTDTGLSFERFAADPMSVLAA